MEWTALMIGFAGSLHCLGMCSPLALAVTGLHKSALTNRVLYNAGRLLMYGLLGAIVAAVGNLLSFDRIQGLVSLAMGLVLLAVGFGGIRRINVPVISTGMLKATRLLKNLFSSQLTRRGRGSMVLMGAINGALPCGLTLVALSWCITLRGPLDGFNFMLLFGAGTLPVMLGLTSALPLILKQLKWTVSGLTSTMTIAAGIALIARVFLVHIPHSAPVGRGLADIILCR